MSVLLSVLLTGSFLETAFAQEMVLQTVDGQQRKGVVQQIDQSGQVTGSGLGDNLKLDSILSIETNRPVKAVSQPMQVYLVGETAWGIAKIAAVEVANWYRESQRDRFGGCWLPSSNGRLGERINR